MNEGELTRQRIIDQAAAFFNQRGFTGCSMQDMMAATDCAEFRRPTCRATGVGLLRAERISLIE